MGKDKVFWGLAAGWFFAIIVFPHFCNWLRPLMDHFTLFMLNSGVYMGFLMGLVMGFHAGQVQEKNPNVKETNK